MKRFTIVALALALGLGFASAQNITKSLQGAPDPRGPVGIDTSNATFFPGHINAFGQVTQPLSVSSCGSLTTPSSLFTAGSTDVAGTVLVEGLTCNVTFGSPFNAAPSCVVQVNGLFAAQTTANSLTVTSTTTGFNMTNTSSGQSVNWICIGNK